jgi:cytochrome c556
MRPFTRSAAALATLTLVACETGSPPPADPQRVVNERVAIMKSLGVALAATGAFTQGKGQAADARAKLGIARTNAERIPDMFPRGTALGDKGVARSRALTTIFASRGDFDAQARALQSKLSELESALAKGTKADASAALAATKVTCSSCHSKYRAADE